MFSATTTTPLFFKLPLMSNPFLIHNPTTTTALLVPKPPFSFSPSLLPSRPFKNLNLCSFPLWASLTKKSPFSSVISHVARTVYQKQEEEGSNWQFQEEDKEIEADWEEGEGGEEEESGGEAGFSEEWGGESYPEPPEEAKLFVGNLPYDVDGEKLAQIFDQAGVVEVSEVIYNRDTEQSRGFGFVTMSTVEEAEKAVEMFHRYDISGRLLTVNKAAPRGSRPELTPRMANPSRRMYVGNLPWQVDNYRLEQVFSEHGKVVEARVVYDRETGRSRGFGFVTMSSESELNDAIAALDGQSLDGRALRVSVAEERQRQRSTF